MESHPAAGPIIIDISSFQGVPANLPTDVISDIFARLPVKSLCRFKCVSKSMYTLLHTPNFIKKHLQRAMKKDPNLILKLDFRLYAVDNEKWSKARKLKVPFAFSLDKVEVSGSCHGLLCISDQRCNEDIYLYNPSTGVYNKLPTPESDVPAIESTCFTAIGFGYHDSEKDYKVIRCVYLYDKPFQNIDSYECEARVYSFRTEKWKKVGAIPFHISSRAALVFNNEFFIWKASRGLGRGMTVLVIYFDMNKEEFKEIARPDVRDPEGAKCQIELGVTNGYFALYHMWRAARVEIWAMKEFGVKESWAKLFVIRRDMIDMERSYVFMKPLSVVKEGEILMEKGEGELVLYDPDNEFGCEINIPGAPRWFSTSAYVGSLVSPFTNPFKLE